MSNAIVGVTWSDDLVGRAASPGENALRYMSLLAEAGLSPLLITPRTGARAAAGVDGLLLTGGPDIAPSRYGQEPGEHLGAVLPELDALELEVFAAVHARGRPVLGICRGHQLLNVALGGTLHQHIAHPEWGDDASAAVHTVVIGRGTHLHDVLGVDSAEVNSGHHQAVDVVADSLTVAARSSDGCIEALESPGQLLLSVQWHPEEMPDTPTSRRLMAAFAQWMDLRGA